MAPPHTGPVTNTNMKKRIDKLPKITFRDMLIKFLDSEGEKYYKKIFKI